MALVGMSNEEKIWNYFKSKGLTNCGIAGLMGNLMAESALNPKNLQNSFEKKLGHNDDSYTKNVDNDTYTNFVYDKAGYGICQWTFWSRKRNLLNFAKARNVSIGDLEMQLNFLYKELSEGYVEVLNILLSTDSVLDASNAVLLQFERPANHSETVKERRFNYSKEYYEKFVKEENDMTNIKEMDNTPDTWAEEAVEWAVENEILYGDNNGNYKLHNNCTRQEMLVFLNRLYKILK